MSLWKKPMTGRGDHPMPSGLKAECDIDGS
jgi:hypothetical protein